MFFCNDNNLCIMGTVKVVEDISLHIPLNRLSHCTKFVHQVYFCIPGWCDHQQEGFVCGCYVDHRKALY